jgi:hypothetical protein
MSYDKPRKRSRYEEDQAARAERRMEREAKARIREAVLGLLKVHDDADATGASVFYEQEGQQPFRVIITRNPAMIAALDAARDTVDRAEGRPVETPQKPAE